jgi:hypothetical protein
MNCHEFQKRLETAAEQQISVATEAAISHARSCANSECRMRWEQSLLMERALAGWRGVRPPIDVTDRVVQEWRPELRGHRHVDFVRSSASRTPSPVGRAAGKAWPAITVTAVLCAAVLSLTVARPEPVATTSRPENTASLVSTAPVQAGPTETPASTDPVLQDMGRSYVGLVQNATYAVTDVVVLTFGGGESLEQPSPAVHWVDRWREELGPVRSEVDDAWDEFFKSFPESLPST